MRSWESTISDRGVFDDTVLDDSAFGGDVDRDMPRSVSLRHTGQHDDEPDDGVTGDAGTGDYDSDAR